MPVSLYCFVIVSLCLYSVKPVYFEDLIRLNLGNLGKLLIFQVDYIESPITISARNYNFCN